MKDLMQLVEKHNISEKYGDAIKQIYKLLGDNRIAKCLSLSCDQELQDSKIWEGLITVYEMKMKVKQRKLLIENHRTSRDQENNGTQFQLSQHQSNVRGMRVLTAAIMITLQQMIQEM